MTRHADGKPLQRPYLSRPTAVTTHFTPETATSRLRTLIHIKKEM